MRDRPVEVPRRSALLGGAEGRAAAPCGSALHHPCLGAEADPPRPVTDRPAYSSLAAGYDAVMAHVDYPMWAGYVQGLVRRYHPEAKSVIELGCGTGAFAVAFQPYGPPPGGYTYRAFDASEDMLVEARETAYQSGRPIVFGHNDFREPVAGPPADVVVLLYDGLNYLLTADEVGALMRTVCDALVPGGLAVIDQSTPANSVNHADGFDDAGETDAFDYVRTSRYDPESRLHTTTFRLRAEGEERVETHVQRAYTMAEVRPLIEAAGLRVEAAYDGFETDAADETAERVHWVLRRPRAA